MKRYELRGEMIENPDGGEWVLRSDAMADIAREWEKRKAAEAAEAELERATQEGMRPAIPGQACENCTYARKLENELRFANGQVNNLELALKTANGVDPGVHEKLKRRLDRCISDSNEMDRVRKANEMDRVRKAQISALSSHLRSYEETTREQAEEIDRIRGASNRLACRLGWHTWTQWQRGDEVTVVNMVGHDHMGFEYSRECIHCKRPQTIVD